MSIFGTRDSRDKIVIDGLIFYIDAAQLRSYPGSGTSWFDLSGNNRTGTFGASTAAPTFNSSNGGSISFDGSNDKVGFSDTSLPSGTSSRTFSIWFYFNVMQLQAAISYGTPNVTNSRQHWAIGTLNNRIWMTTEGPNYNFGDTTRTINTWYFVTATYDGTNLTRFINGSQVATNNLVTDGAQINTTLNGNFTIGDYTSTAQFPWNGRVAHVMIHNRALSSTEILQNYNATRLRFGL
jgi:hypothetical protein